MKHSQRGGPGSTQSTPVQLQPVSVDADGEVSHPVTLSTPRRLGDVCLFAIDFFCFPCSFSLVGILMNKTSVICLFQWCRPRVVG